MRKNTRKKIRPSISLPKISGTLILSLTCLILCVVLVFTTSPQNIIFLSLFFISLFVFFVSLLRNFSFSHGISFIAGSTAVLILALKVFQMATSINIVLTLAIGICFASFAKGKQ